MKKAIEKLWAFLADLKRKIAGSKKEKTKRAANALIQKIFDLLKKLKDFFVSGVNSGVKRIGSTTAVKIVKYLGTQVYELCRKLSILVHIGVANIVIALGKSIMLLAVVRSQSKFAMNPDYRETNSIKYHLGNTLRQQAEEHINKKVKEWWRIEDSPFGEYIKGLNMFKELLVKTIKDNVASIGYYSKMAAGAAKNGIIRALKAIVKGAKELFVSLKNPETRGPVFKALFNSLLERIKEGIRVLPKKSADALLGISLMLRKVGFLLFLFFRIPGTQIGNLIEGTIHLASGVPETFKAYKIWRQTR